MIMVGDFSHHNIASLHDFDDAHVYVIRGISEAFCGILQDYKLPSTPRYLQSIITSTSIPAHTTPD